MDLKRKRLQFTVYNGLSTFYLFTHSIKVVLSWSAVRQCLSPNGLAPSYIVDQICVKPLNTRYSLRSTKACCWNTQSARLMLR